MSFADLHCHLLWGIDDGAKTAEDSLAMAKSLHRLGFRDVAPSPHCRPEYPGFVDVEARRAEVQAMLDREGVELKLHPGGEHVFDEGFLARAQLPERRSINRTRYMLVEAPYVGTIPGFVDLLFRLQTKGVTPVIAHPERCAQFEGKNQASEAVRVGALLQLDIGALIGRYGKPALKLSKQFLEDGLYAIGATDLHSPVGAEDWVARSIDELKRRAGAAGVERLLDINPHRLLAGQELDPA